MAPPQLARNAPILDFVEPVVVGSRPVFRHEPHLAAFDRLRGQLREALADALALFVQGLFGHRDEPLVGEHRLDDGARAVAARDFELVGLDFHQQAPLFQLLDHRLAGALARQARERLGGLLLAQQLAVVVVDLHLIQDRGAHIQDVDQLKPVALARGVVVRVVRGGDLHAARAERRVHGGVGDHGDLAAHQRQNQRLAHHVGVAIVFGVDRDGDVAQHRLGPGRGHRQALGGVILEPVENAPHAALLVFLDDLQVGDRGFEHGIPVGQALVAVDQAHLA